MTKYYETIHNIDTGEIVTRDYTPEEIAQQKEIEKQNEKTLTEMAEKSLLRQAVLDKLGLSADEIAALLG